MEGNMRIISGIATNFASYKELEFSFDEDGLTLIQGATGSGKSTLCDLAPWALFGKTAKGGAADEIISWKADSPTKVTITLLLRDETLEIVRIRGKGKNDLSFNNTRGKDLADTQKLINTKLGIDYDTYMAGAYFHEFSKTAQFFTTSAKERRALCEQIVDLSLAKKIQEDLTVKKKESKKEVETSQSLLKEAQFGVDFISNNLEKQQKAETEATNEVRRESKRINSLRDNFEKNKAELLVKLSQKLNDLSSQFDYIKQTRIALSSTILSEDEIKQLQTNQKSEGVCLECGGPKNNTKNKDLQALIMQNEINKQKRSEYRRQQDTIIEHMTSIDKQIADETNRENTYQDALNNIQTKYESFSRQIDSTIIDLAKVMAEETKRSDKLVAVKQELADIELLSEVTDTLRSRIIVDTITQVQDNTNRLLSSHFDAELTVNFEVVDADKLEVYIHKDDNLCVYTQLSKGQRQLLKLCFGLSIMKAVGNNNAVKFNAIFLDESLDGLDDNLKVKSYSLLQTLSLEYGSVFVVEHNEALKSLFPKRFIVTNTNGESTIEKS